MSLHIDGQQVWIFIPKQLAMIFFIFLPQPFILKQDDFVKLHSNGPDSILNVSGAPKTRITKLGDMVISSISVSTHVVKSLTIKQLYFFKLSWAWQVMRGLILSGLDCTWYDMIQKSDLLSLVQLLALCLVFLFLLAFAAAVCPLLKKTALLWQSLTVSLASLQGW